MDGTIGFSTSNRSIHPLWRRSDCSWGLIRIKKREYRTRFCHISITRHAMAKRMAALDSAGQIRPSTSLEGVLLVGGAFAAGNCKKQ